MGLQSKHIFQELFAAKFHGRCRLRSQKCHLKINLGFPRLSCQLFMQLSQNPILVQLDFRLKCFLRENIWLWPFEKSILLHLANPYHQLILMPNYYFIPHHKVHLFFLKGYHHSIRCQEV